MKTQAARYEVKSKAQGRVHEIHRGGRKVAAVTATSLGYEITVLADGRWKLADSRVDHAEAMALAMEYARGER